VILPSHFKRISSPEWFISKKDTKKSDCLIGTKRKFPNKKKGSCDITENQISSQKTRAAVLLLLSDSSATNVATFRESEHAVQRSSSARFFPPRKKETLF